MLKNELLKYMPVFVFLRRHDAMLQTEQHKHIYSIFLSRSYYQLYCCDI